MTNYQQSYSPSLAQTADLWLKIDQLHLNFLAAEETPKKYDLRQKLEGYVQQYLCLVPQERKFCSSLMSNVLMESAEWVPEFSVIKAAEAFLALEKYAANLLNQPWRPEFKEIKEYCGFYKHKISSCLFAPVRIFQAMGYRLSDSNSLVYEGHADLDKLTTVARDCLLAYVECQIIISIFHGMAKEMPCRVTWGEIINFRKNHIGIAEDAIRSLIYEKNHQKYQVTMQPPIVESVGDQNPNVLPVRTTAKLIDLSSSDENGSSCNGNPRNKFPDSNANNLGEPQIPLTIKLLEEENQRKSQMLQTYPKEFPRDQSNSNADVLQLLAKISLAKTKQNEADLRDHSPQTLSPLTREEQELLSRISNNKNNNDVQEGNENGITEVDAIHHRFRGHSSKQKDQLLSIKDVEVAKRSERHSKPLEPPISSPTPLEKSKMSYQSSWECFACTYSNPKATKVCDMCGKSRDSPDIMRNVPSSSGGEDSASETEGIACYKCTLLNPKKQKICEACGASLKKK